MKKKTRRSNSQYPALDPALNLKTRLESLDYDYVDKLSEEDKSWLNAFTNEYTHADFTTNKKRTHRKKKVEHERNKHLKKLLEDFLQTLKVFVKILNEAQITSKSKIKLKRSINKFKKQIRTQIQSEFTFIKDYYKRESEHRNNARNACILTKAKARGMTKSLDLLPETYLDKTNVEDTLIHMIDNKREEE